MSGPKPPDFVSKWVDGQAVHPQLEISPKISMAEMDHQIGSGDSKLLDDRPLPVDNEESYYAMRKVWKSPSGAYQRCRQSKIRCDLMDSSSNTVCSALNL